MVNQTVLEYLLMYKDSYRLEDLKKKILRAGYSNQDIEEALSQVNSGQRVTSGTTEQPEPVRSRGWLKVLAFFLILLALVAIGLGAWYFYFR